MARYLDPFYYEIAFSFIDPKKQVDSFIKLHKGYGRCKLRRFLDIACGPSLQLREIVKRGYEAVGLDNDPRMLKYLGSKVRKIGCKIELVRADFSDFVIKKKCDFAFIMMGSLRVNSNDDFLKHLNLVARSLNKGGLYLIQNHPLDWINLKKRGKWTIKRGGITVKTTFNYQLKDTLKQIFTEKLILDIDNNGVKKRLSHKEDFKLIFPQEFKLLVEKNDKFKFLGWFKCNNDGALCLGTPLEQTKKIKRNFIVLRKK